MSVQVATPAIRIRFIEESEFISLTSFDGVGPNTPFPVKVTPDELQEILYQVRRSEITGGNVSYDGFTIGLTPTPSPSNLWYISESEKSYGYRGYAFPITSAGYPFQSDPPPVDALKYFSNDYSLETEDDPDIKVYEAKNEYAIWHPVLAGEYPSAFGQALATGFTNEVGVESVVDPLDDSMVYPDAFYGLGYSGPSFDYGDGASSGLTQFSLTFGNVAIFKDIDDSGNPFSSENEIYLGIEAGLLVFTDPDGTFDFFSARSWESGSGWNFVFNLNIELKGSTLVIPMYSREEPDSVSDIVITATEWWPYAGTWNPATGARA